MLCSSMNCANVFLPAGLVFFLKFAAHQENSCLQKVPLAAENVSFFLQQYVTAAIIQLVPTFFFSLFTAV